MTKLYYFFSLLFISNCMKAAEITNVNFHPDGNLIVITFDVNGQTDASYFIGITAIDRNGKKIVPRTLNGDFPYVFTGRNRKITWDVLKDVEELTGEFSISIRVLNTEYLNAGQGPSNALLSVIMPGWGDNYVNNDDAVIRPYQITLVYLGALGCGFYSRQKYKENYAAYLASTRQSEIDSYYENATFYSSQSKIWFGIAAVVWSVDVVHVLVKGINNQNSFHPNKNSLSFRVNPKEFTLAYNF